MDESPLDSIIDKAIVMTESAFNARYPKGTIPRRSKDYGRVFVCRRGCNLKYTNYTEEFPWDEVAHDTEDDVINLMEKLQADTKSVKEAQIDKRKRDDDDFDAKIEADTEVGTPRKKHKISTVTTPRKPRTPSKLLTPSHKR